MTITVAIHEATRTGAPRLGALIARELARREPVRAVVMKDGPLTPWLRETLGAKNLTVCAGDPFHHETPFDERVRLAGELLEGEGSDIVYVNSLAASVFAIAAAQRKRRTILHVHEKSAEMFNLLAYDVTKIEVMRVTDAAVFAADEIRADLAQMFHTTPADTVTFGIAVEIEAIRKAAAERASSPLNILGQPLAPGARAIVGMCGAASVRKGADIFLKLALAAPECDFLWVGGWRPEETSENLAYDEFLKRAPTNLYLAGAVDNPYAYMRMMDLFFLSSREDPNPLVLAEALALGVPILTFTRTTAIADKLGRCAIVCYGEPNVADALRVLRASPVETLRSPGFRSVGESFVAEYDLRAKMTKIFDLIARLRGETGAGADDAARRAVAGGGVELSFS